MSKIIYIHLSNKNIFIWDNKREVGENRKGINFYLLLGNVSINMFLKHGLIYRVGVL